MDEPLTGTRVPGLKIIAINGSPRAKASNTEILLQEFLKGAQSMGAKTETIYLKEKNIHFCTGCYTCWGETPGICVFQDDMPGLLEKVKGCNIIVYATPLYNYNMTSLLKAFQERLLPLLDPHLIKIRETYRHPPRYEVNRKMVLISTCGFPETSHFEGLRQVFRKMAYHSQTPLVGELLIPSGDLLKKRILKEKFHGVLKAAYRAGIEVIKEGSVTKETEAQIQKSPISTDEMAEMVNHWWNGRLKRIGEGNSEWKNVIHEP